MAIKFKCSNCGVSLSISEEQSGKKTKCPRCQTILTVPVDSKEPEKLPEKRSNSVIRLLLIANIAAVAFLFMYSMFVLSPKYKDLSKKISGIEKDIEIYGDWTSDNSDRMDKMETSKSPVLDIVDGTVCGLDSPQGKFAVKIADMNPYLDGYKVTLEVGNLMNASFRDVSFFLTWGTKKPEKPDGTDYFEHFKPYHKKLKQWRESLHRKIFHIAERLEAGKWTKTEVVLSPAKAEEMMYIEMSYFISRSVALKKTP